MPKRRLAAFTLSLGTATLLFGFVATRIVATAPVGPTPATWSDDLTPIAASDWNDARAAHLIERAGFGGTPEDIARLAAMTPQQAVDSLVNFESLKNDLKPFDESGIWD